MKKFNGYAKFCYCKAWVKTMPVLDIDKNHNLCRTFMFCPWCGKRLFGHDFSRREQGEAV